MKNLYSKIILTIITSIMILGVIGLLIRFYGALCDLDDDLMFIYGFTLMALTCTIVLVAIFSSIIESIWKKKKIKKERNYEK